MLIKVDKLNSVIDNLVLYSSFNIILIANEEKYVQRVLDYLFRVSPYRFETVFINSPDQLLYVYRLKNKFIGIVLAETPEQFESVIEDYLVKSLTTYNYSYNQIDTDKVKASIPDVIHRLNAKYLFIDQTVDKELENKENNSGKIQ